MFTRPGHARSVDWLDMFLYAGPTLLYESFQASSKCDDESLSTFIALVTACSIFVEWEVADNDIELVTR